MTDEEFLLHVLEDKKPHSGEQINISSQAQRGKRMTIHSRAASLRKQGHIITAIKQGQDYLYQWHGKRDQPYRIRAKPVPIVQGYIYSSDGDNTRSGRIVQIIGRVEPDGEYLSPQFEIEFSNGSRDTAWGDELTPWYPAG